MPPSGQDPTFLVLSWVFLAAMAWTLVACLLLLSRALRTPPSMEVGASMSSERAGIPTTIYRRWDIGIVLFLFLMFGSPLLVGSEPPKPPPDVTTDRIQSSILVLFLLAGFAAFIASFRLHLFDWLGLRWKQWRSVLWLAPVSLMAIWAVFGILLWCGYMDWMKSLGVDTVQESVRTLQQSHDPAILSWMCFAALFAAPVCEEVIFRGYCYPVLKKYAGANSAMFITALVFACAHANLPSALPLFLLGLLLVLVYEHTRSLWAPMAVHFLFNTATVVLLFRSRWPDTPFEFP